MTTLEGVYCGVVMLVEVFVTVSGGSTFAAVTFPFGIRDMAAAGRKHLCNGDNSDDKGANLPPSHYLLLTPSGIRPAKICDFRTTKIPNVFAKYIHENVFCMQLYIHLFIIHRFTIVFRLS